MKIDFKRKNWDSSFFKIEIAEAYIENFDKKEFKSLVCKFISAKLGLVYLYPLDSLSKEILLELNIPQVDNKIIYSKNLTKSETCCIENIKPYEMDDHYHSLLNLALASGEFSRFKSDTNFKNCEFNRLYTTWLNNSIEKIIADDVLVWRNSMKEIKGFVTYRITGKTLKIGLIAVDADSQGQGIGKNLLHCIEHIAVNKSIFNIEVETQQENRLACKFYESQAYIIRRLIPIFHLWIH